MSRKEFKKIYDEMISSGLFDEEIFSGKWSKDKDIFIHQYLQNNKIGIGFEEFEKDYEDNSKKP